MPKNALRPLVVLLLAALLLAACGPGPADGVTPVPATPATLLLPVATINAAAPATLPAASPTTATTGATATIEPESSATWAGASNATSAPAPATIAPTRAARLMPDMEINGCLEQQAPTPAGAKADVVVGTKVGAGTGSVTMATGQVVEVQLAPTVRWTLVTQDSNRVLLPANHNGWYDSVAQVCVWRFSAQTPGTAGLVYSGRPICAPGKLCPKLVVESDFTVTVQG